MKLNFEYQRLIQYQEKRLLILSGYNNFSINISCLTIDKITIALSNFSLAKKNLEIPPHINSMCKK